MQQGLGLYICMCILYVSIIFHFTNEQWSYVQTDVHTLWHGDISEITVFKRMKWNCQYANYSICFPIQWAKHQWFLRDYEQHPALPQALTVDAAVLEWENWCHPQVQLHIQRIWTVSADAPRVCTLIVAGRDACQRNTWNMTVQKWDQNRCTYCWYIVELYGSGRRVSFPLSYCAIQ